MKTINGSEVVHGTVLPTTNVDAVIDIIYSLSTWLGNGFLHYVEENNLDSETLKELVDEYNEKGSLYMDYVKGRCCKVKLRKVDTGEVWVSIEKDDWTDRVHDQFQVDLFFRLVSELGDK